MDVVGRVAGHHNSNKFRTETTVWTQTTRARIVVLEMCSRDTLLSCQEKCVLDGKTNAKDLDIGVYFEANIWKLAKSTYL